jgi:hypothetical protein
MTGCVFASRGDMTMSAGFLRREDDNLNDRRLANEMGGGGKEF